MASAADQRRRSRSAVVICRSFASRSLSWRRVSLLHEPFALAPLQEIVLSKQSGLFRSAYVVANFLLPRLQSSRSGLTQVLIKPRCQIPKQIYPNPFHHELSPIGAPP